MVPTSYQNRAIGRPWSSFFEILCDFESMCFLVFGSAKNRPQIANFSNVGGQFEKTRLVLEGSAAEAACWGREGVGVLKIEMHLLSDLARRTEGGGGLEATASAADPYENSCWWILYCMSVLRLL